MAADQDLTLVLRELEPGDSFAGFSVGDAAFQPLKTFLRRDAKKYSEQLLAKTYVLASETKVAAYISLVCGEILSQREMADLDGARFTYDHYPALKIARLAVSKAFQKKHKLGTNLVDFAVGRSREIANIAGCRFVVVDAKRPSVGFYEKRGFRLIDTEENKEREQPIMFLDLKGV